jgi:hypothetical protein
MMSNQYMPYAAALSLLISYGVDAETAHAAASMLREIAGTTVKDVYFWSAIFDMDGKEEMLKQLSKHWQKAV